MIELAEIALFTDDVVATGTFYRDVVGAEPVSEWPVAEPHDYPWGRSAYLRDPDGRLVEAAVR